MGPTGRSPAHCYRRLLRERRLAGYEIYYLWRCLMPRRPALARGGMPASRFLLWNPVGHFCCWCRLAIELLHQSSDEELPRFVVGFLRLSQGKH